ncbi:unnamed protein product [Didymodactylos carnosus]|uniref:Ty3 transposon capsid-like protein domain-containing protein n=1 Tax=Didymodactylos carnosus TaxID=1234261 RepID=A0A8S2E8T1_9BILA|nr:unnamed protein product [Didymodactylos carnosus]CAF3845554.1 unnamed protein product [Didymodactylos carnosus]
MLQLAINRHIDNKPTAIEPSSTSAHHWSASSTPQFQVSSYPSLIHLETMVQSAFLDDLVKNRKKFGGGKQNVKAWLDDLEHKMQANSWPEDLRLKYVSTFLDGEANDWFNENSSRMISWSSFKGQIIKQFTSTYSDIQAFQRLKDYHQTIHQTITQYYNEMIKLLKEVDPSMEETLKVNYLMSNMNNSLKYEMYKKQPKTTAQFLDIAKRFEDLQKLKENDQRRNSYLTERFPVADASDGDASELFTIKKPSLMFITTAVNNKNMRIMIDTGATNSIITERTLRQTKHKKFIKRNHQKLTLADGYSPLEVIGKVELEIKLRSTVTTIQALVVKHLSVEWTLGKRLDKLDSHV